MTNHLISEDWTCQVSLLIDVLTVVESFSSIGVTEADINNGLAFAGMRHLLVAFMLNVKPAIFDVSLQSSATTK